MSIDEEALVNRTLDIFKKSDESLAYRLSIKNVPIELLQEAFNEPDETVFIGGFNVSPEAYERLKIYIEGKPDVDFKCYDVQMTCYQDDVA